ncbi:helix-turn-helix transcriptional regulator [Nocardia vulneris]|uniref:Transcriptional regulator n=1 Tax=Nocardia vulneris TaxID=1141657 RepID=A0ABR4Z1Y9_9NOCA|nr:transcriptional regulator [Nocardia vulneris]KIA59382.1 transcriptional regulator [Nocardia vulneris]
MAEITAQQCVDILFETTGRRIGPGTFRSYAHRGYAPAPVRHIGRTPVWDEAEIVAWIAERPGQGTRTDLSN